MPCLKSRGDHSPFLSVNLSVLWAISMVCALTLVNVSHVTSDPLVEDTSTTTITSSESSTTSPPVHALESISTSPPLTDDITVTSKSPPAPAPPPPPPGWQVVESVKKMTDRANLRTRHPGVLSRPFANRVPEASSSAKNRPKNLLTLAAEDPAAVKRSRGRSHTYSSRTVTYPARRIVLPPHDEEEYSALEELCFSPYQDRDSPSHLLSVFPTKSDTFACQVTCSVLVARSGTDGTVYYEDAENKTHNINERAPCHATDSSLVCLDGRCRNPQKGRVKIAIINATIINEETDETYNPYVRLFVKGDLVHTSKPKRNTNTPSWKFALAIDNFMIDEPIQFKLMTRNPTGDIELFSHRVTVSQFKSTQSPVTTISSGSTCKYFPDSNFSRLCFGVEWTPKTIV